MTDQELEQFASTLIDEAYYIRKKLALHQTIDDTVKQVYRQVEELLR